MIDKRIKQNKEILDKIPNHQCKRLEGADLVMWIRQYCTSNGFKMTPDAQEYVSASHRFMARCTGFIYENRI